MPNINDCLQFFQPDLVEITNNDYRGCLPCSVAFFVATRKGTDIFHDEVKKVTFSIYDGNNLNETILRFTLKG